MAGIARPRCRAPESQQPGRKRHRHAWLLPAMLLLAACGGSSESNPEAITEAPPACNTISFEGTPLTHCVADPAHHTVFTVLADGQARPYRSLAAYAAARPADAPVVAFAMNGGMYDEDGQPIGYFVEQGDRLHRLNRADGPGNFHLKPNGVFFGTGSKWQVMDSESFYSKISERPDFATQSGPMLVVDGKIHAGFDEDGESRKLRNGVGVGADGRAHFVISDAPVSFGKFARFFRDELKTPNALFLDGSVSQLWDPARDRMDVGATLGPLIIVENRATAP